MLQNFKPRAVIHGMHSDSQAGKCETFGELLLSLRLTFPFLTWDNSITDASCYGAHL